MEPEPLEPPMIDLVGGPVAGEQAQFDGRVGKEIIWPLYDGSFGYLTPEGDIQRAYPEAVYKRQTDMCYVFAMIRPAFVPEGCIPIVDWKPWGSER